jgi:hypothetical protein
MECIEITRIIGNDLSKESLGLLESPIVQGI